MTTTNTTPKKRGRPAKSGGLKLPAKAKATAAPKVKAESVVPATDSLPVNPFIFEILDLVSAQKSNAKKVEVLRNYEHESIKTVFVWNYDSSVVSLLPPGEVPYGETNAQTTFAGTLSDNIAKEAAGGESATGQDLDGRNKTSIRREFQHFYHFVKGGNNTLSTTRREMMFIQMLEGLHPKEAEILVLIKDKDLETKYNVSLDNVKQAYPDMTWGGRS
mgnify:CR=1 FL=1|tara:strand:- start:167 stop:820 length:654 start_codon:yes stop_codon:yes gene_type:complete